MTVCLFITLYNNHKRLEKQVKEKLASVLSEFNINNMTYFDSDICALKQCDLEKIIVADIGCNYRLEAPYSGTPLCLLCDEYIYNKVDEMIAPKEHRYHISVAKKDLQNICIAIEKCTQVFAEELIEVFAGEDITELKDYTVIKCSTHEMVNTLLLEIEQEGCLIHDYHFVIY